MPRDLEQPASQRLTDVSRPLCGTVELNDVEADGARVRDEPQYPGVRPLVMAVVDLRVNPPPVEPGSADAPVHPSLGPGHTRDQGRRDVPGLGEPHVRP